MTKRSRISKLATRLDIFITSRCNLNCSYCSAKELISQKEAKTLTFKELCRAVDLFSLYKDRKTPGSRTIAFTGGEPFLEWELVKRGVEYIRSKRERFLISVTTNGTLLDEEKVKFLLKNRAFPVISLDGTGDVNDSCRKFRNGKASVYDVVVKRLKKLPPGCIKDIHVTPTVTSRTIDKLIGSVKCLRGLGLRYIELGLDAYEFWPAKKLSVLERVLSDFKKYSMENINLKSLACGDGNVFDAFFQDYTPEGTNTVPADTLCLSPDGVFFPCEILCTSARDDRYAIGDLNRGVDFKKFRSIYMQAANYITKYDSANSVLSPPDRYFHAVIHRRSPREILKNSFKVTEIFKKQLRGLFEFQKRLESSAKSGLFNRNSLQKTN